jgi:6-phosphogluconate dehydrogenase
VKAPKFDWGKLDLQEVLKDCLVAYNCSRLVMYAQAFSLLRNASMKNAWEMNLAEMARALSGGCVIRCTLLKRLEQ